MYFIYYRRVIYNKCGLYSVVVSTLVFETSCSSEYREPGFEPQYDLDLLCPFCWPSRYQKQILATPDESSTSQLDNDALMISIRPIFVELCDLEVDQNLLTYMPRPFSCAVLLEGAKGSTSMTMVNNRCIRASDASSGAIEGESVQWEGTQASIDSEIHESTNPTSRQMILGMRHKH